MMQRFRRGDLWARAFILAGLGILAGVSFVSADDLTEFVWSGAVTAESARVNARLRADSNNVRLAVSAAPDFATPVFSGMAVAELALNNRVAALAINGLQPDTQYYYRIEANGAPDNRIGRFKTFPASAATFTFAFGACAHIGSNHQVFATIRQQQPLFFINVGDLHYANIAVNDVGLFRAAYNSVLAAPRQAQLYRETPIVYMWDDHDFGGNNSNGTSPSKPAAQAAYREYVPHYPLIGGGGANPLYQAFSVGRVRFLVTDLRSEKSPRGDPDTAAKTTMGAAQKGWFKQELLNARDQYKLTVWIAGIPWVHNEPGFDSDRWNGYRTERAELANFIADNHINNLCMLSGDAHMLAIDDGTNTNYSNSAIRGFPLFHAAALDQAASIKGGPYSSGTFPGGGHFGRVTITDEGGETVRVGWSGRNYLDEEIVSWQFTSPYPLDLPPARTWSGKIGSAADDAEESGSGSVTLDSSDLELVRDSSNQTVGLRFFPVIPRGAQIEAASIRFAAEDTNSESTALTIRVEAADNAPAFASSSGNLSQRTTGLQSVGWTLGAWIAGQSGAGQLSPDLSPLVQEIIDRPGWQQGHALTFLITGTGKRVAVSFDGDADQAPELRINFLTPFERWRRSRFNEAELAQTELSGPLADPDGNGFVNIVEYAFAPLPVLPLARIVNVAGSRYLTLSYQENPLAGDLTFAVERSLDLESWSSAPADILEISREENAGGSISVTVRSTFPLQGPEGRQFFRVRVEM